MKRVKRLKRKRIFKMTEQPHSEQTICEIHRRMYRMITERNPEDALIPLLKIAFDMAKKMNNKLRQYKDSYDEGWWEVHRLDGGDIDAA